MWSPWAVAEVFTPSRLSESGAIAEHPILAATGEGDRAESRVFRWNAVTQGASG